MVNGGWVNKNHTCKIADHSCSDIPWSPLLAFMGSYAYWRKVNQLTRHFKTTAIHKKNEPINYSLKLVTIIRETIISALAKSTTVAEHLLQFSLHGLLNFSLNPVLNNNFHSPMVYSHLAPNICFNDEKHMFWGWETKFYDFLTCFLVWLKYFWARNIQFLKVYEKLIIFIKSLILNIFWWQKCLTIALKVLWVDLQNQNLSKINISWIKILESDINNQRKHERKQ